MPNGSTHAKIHKIGILPVALATAPVGLSSPVDYALILAGYGMGAFIDPDLDQVGLTQAEGRALRHFGFLGAIWVGYWLPYGYLLKHRGKLSHFPFLSTFVRLVYISAPLWLFAFLLQKYTSYPVMDWFIYYSRAYLPIWFGLGIADLFHWIADIWPKKKKVIRKHLNKIR